MLEYPREVYGKTAQEREALGVSQPRALSGLAQLTISACAVCVAAAAITFTVATARQERNAQLVGIGIAVLRADPEKESQVTAAREWALDLIDANAGGVKFSKEAREQLMRHRLTTDTSWGGVVWGEASPLPPDQPKK